jgi:hypothetical protein
MQGPKTETFSSVSGLRRALELSPYLFVVVSVAGLSSLV